MKGTILEACCYLVAAILWYVDSKRNRDSGLSKALLLPTLWMIRVSSRSWTLWLQHGAVYEGDDIGSSHDRVFFSVFLVLGIIVLLRRRVDWASLLKSNAFLLLLIAYFGLSTMWADDVGVSLKRWVRCLGDITMALVVVTEKSPREAIERVFRRTFVFLIPLSIVWIKYIPSLGRSQAKHWGDDFWIGVATHKNPLGQLVMLAALYFVLDLVRNWRGDKFYKYIDLLYLGMIAWLLNAGGNSRSMTSIMCLLLGGCVLYLFHVYRDRIGLLTAATIGLCLLFVFVQFVLDQLVQGGAIGLIVQSTGKDMTFTGRTDLWAVVVDLARKRPVLGYGYGSFWTERMCAYLKTIFSWGPGQAHNGYIDLFAQSGAVGILLVALGAIAGVRNALSMCAGDFELGRLKATLIIIILVHNMFESSLGRQTTILWFVFLLATLNAQRLRIHFEGGGIPEPYPAATGMAT